MKFLIADDHPVVRRGLKQIIIDEFDNCEIHETEYGKNVLDLVQQNEYDLVILDISLPDVSGMEILNQLQSLYPDLKVLILSALSEEQYGLRILKAGAFGFIPKESAPDDLINAVKLILAGKKYVSESLANKMVDVMNEKTGEKIHDTLSSREFEVLVCIGKGKSPKQIAEELALSIQTISTYRARVLTKMHMKSNAELTRYCLIEKLVD